MGAPPHGGFAMGLERFVALLANEPNIREIVAFPKSRAAAIRSRALRLRFPTSSFENWCIRVSKETAYLAAKGA